MTAQTRNSRLDKASGVPLYRQIENILRDEISLLAEGEQRPMTEDELIRRFAVSRAPVRQALRALAEDGYVYRERAKGTFPIPGRARGYRLPENIWPGALMYQLLAEGLQPTSRVRDLRHGEVSEEQARRYGLQAGEHLLEFHRLIWVEDEPLLFSRVWLRTPVEFSPTAEEIEDAESAFTLLEQRLGVVFGRTHHELWASSADAEAAELLEVAEGSPVLLMESTFTSREGDVIAWRTAVHRPDTFKIRSSNLT